MLFTSVSTEVMNSIFFRNVRLTDALLHVRSLGTMLAFYRDVLGFQAVAAGNRRAELSADGRLPALIVLEERPEATERPAGTPGLFHLAFLFPHRMALASAFWRLKSSGYPIHGASDHGVSEAIYAVDPEGNGIELYADRPAEDWPRMGDFVDMVTRPLGYETLLAGSNSFLGDYRIPPDTILGHIHLQVVDLSNAEKVLTSNLGMKVRQRHYPGAMFFAYDGYHHHVATNVWGVRGGPESNILGLSEVTLRVSADLTFDPLVESIDIDGVTLKVFRRQPGG